MALHNLTFKNRPQHKPVAEGDVQKAMTDLEKMRKKAAKLANPKPQELQSGSFRCRLRVGDEYISVVDKDPEIAHAKVLAMKAGLLQEQKDNESKKAGNLSLSDAIDAYIEARSNVLSPSTINGYNEIKRNRFPSLMNTKVKSIDEQALQKAVNAEAEKVGYKTIKNALGLVVAVVSEYKDISVKRIKMPQRKTQEHKYLDEAGMIDLFEAIRGCFAELPILLAVWLGMRRSEIMGLCWDSIDFDAGTIKVQRTYVKDKEKGYVLREEMKTEASRRTLDCPGYILAKLDAYQPDKSKRVGRVFKMHPNTIYEVLKDVCKKNDIEFVGVHGLRHTNATVMLSLGIIDKVAMARGGWSTDITMKQVYQHLFQSDKQTSGQKVDSFFESIASGINPKMVTQTVTQNQESH